MVLYSPQRISITGPSRRKLRLNDPYNLQQRFGLAAEDVAQHRRDELQDSITAQEEEDRNNNFALSQEQLALQRKQAEDAANNSQIGAGINAAGLALQSKDTLVKAGKGLINTGKGIFGRGASSAPSATGATPAAAPTSPAPYGIGPETTTAATGGKTAAGLSSGASDVLFSEGGSGAIEAGTGALATGGEVEAGTGALSTGASTAGSTGGSVLGGIASGVSYAVPYYALAKLGGALGNKVFEGEKSGFLGNSYGKGISESLERPLNVEQYWAQKAGIDKGSGAQVALDLLNPLSAPERWISDQVGTWICMEIDKHSSLSRMKGAALSIFKNYCVRHHRRWAVHYLKNAPKLIEKINDTVEDPKQFWLQQKLTFVDNIIDLLLEDAFEEAFVLYKNSCLNLVKQFKPEIDDFKE